MGMDSPRRKTLNTLTLLKNWLADKIKDEKVIGKKKTLYPEIIKQEKTTTHHIQEAKINSSSSEERQDEI